MKVGKSALSGKVIMITRSAEQSKGFAQLLENEGAIPFLFPTIKTVPVEPDEDTKRILKEINDFNAVVFTSVNAVKWFFKLLEKINVSFPSEIDIAAVGASTAAYLSSLGFKVDIIPSEYVAESLVEAIEKQLPKGGNVLIPRAKVTREVIGPELREKGFLVTEVITYETVPDNSCVESAVDALKRRSIDAVTFTSGSTVKNFYSLISAKIDIKEALDGVAVAVIGPVTAKAARELGLKVDVIPEEYTVPGLIEALKSYFAKSLRFNKNL